VNAARQAASGALRLLWEMVTGRRTVEQGGPWLYAFQALPAPVRDLLRWVLRPRQRFLFGRLRALSHDRVLSGPFVGMQLRGRPTAPELLGSYERELHDVVRELGAMPFTTIVNVGARHGYYALGFARLNSSARVLAFEGDGASRVVLEEAVRVNGAVERVTVGGFADMPVFTAALGVGAGALVVCDIDGGEVTLLDPAAVPALTLATILVECHGPPEAASEPVMVMRFLPTHEVRRIATEARVLTQLPPGVAEPWRSRMPRELEALMQEHRTRLPQSWLLLTPRVAP
jgi:hypothetical protein